MRAVALSGMALALLSLAGCGLAASGTGVNVGEQAPEISGTDADGGELRLSDFRGKVVVLDFWAGWCRPCMSMVPHNRALVEHYRDRPVVLLGVNADRSRADLQHAQEANRINWRSWFDEDGAIGEAFGIEAYPTVLVLDKAGVIRYISVGVPGEGEVEKAVEEALKRGS